MAPLNVFLKVRTKSFLKKARKGAPVLETVLLIVAAIVIIGALITAFVGKDTQGGLLAKIMAGIEDILNLNPLK